MAIGDTVKTKHLTATQLSDTFVAQVDGIDWSQPKLSPEIRGEVIDLINRFGVLIFRNTGIDDQGHLDFSASLGELDSLAKYTSQKDVVYRTGSPMLYDAGNIDMQGNIIKEGSREFEFRKGNYIWHTDSSFNQHRQSFSLLRSVVVPPANTGGNTQFANSLQAYQDMPQEKKDRIEPLIAFHNREHSRQLASDTYKATEEEKQNRPGATHRLVQTHPNGRKHLYVGAHAAHILNMPKDEGQQLIRELITYASQPKYVYNFAWPEKEDATIVMWDNRQVMHRAESIPNLMHKRDLRRTSIMDDSPFAHGIKV